MIPGGKLSFVDGPFAGTRGLVAGCTAIEVEFEDGFRGAEAAATK